MHQNDILNKFIQTYKCELTKFALNGNGRNRYTYMKQIFMNIEMETLKEFEIAAKAYQMCRKTPSFSYGDIRHVHRIYASN